MYSRRGRFNKKNRPYFHKGSNNKFQNKTYKKEYRHQDQLKEVEVGITEFISDLEGFSGIIKARYSDFQVNEINLEGNIAKLTDTSIPKDFVSKTEKIDCKEVPESPLELIPQDKWDAIKNLLTTQNDDKINLEADSLSKEDRIKIHEVVKSHFGQKIVASTITIEDKKYMQFKRYNKEDKQDIRFQWPKDKGEYVYFLVYKEALDTMDACLKISDCVGMSPGNFTYAGVKDKRAKTTQWFCVRKVEPWKLLSRTRPLRNVKIGNISYKDVPLKLGQLQANKFRIALRNVTGSDELINKSMKQVSENGFINFFGLQRFGNDKEVPTFEIGINLLLGKWKEAAQLILKPKSSDDPFDDVSKAKKIYAETESAEKAFEVLEQSKNRCVEARLLEGLKNGNTNDYVNALENIPRNMRLLYIHSFQSLIWNKMVSKRIQLFGMKPVEGDFVLVKTDKEENQASSLEIPDDDVLENIPQHVWETKLYENHTVAMHNFFNFLKKFDKNNPEQIPKNHKYKKRSEWVTVELMEAINLKGKLYKQYNKDRNNKVLEREYKDLRNKITSMVKDAKKEYQLKLEMKAKEEEPFKCEQEVKALTAAELSDYTIYDIVLPLPGYDIIYPENLKECYKEALEEHGLTLEMTKQKVKTYTLCGNYRKILERVQDLSWKILHYNNPTDNLIRSDFEELKGNPEPKDAENGQYKALVMEFTLSSSSYATMVLREILKADTSSSAQARLNDYHETKEQKKILIDPVDEKTEPSKACEVMQSSSLLSDPEKYAEFKNNIFNPTESPVKRKNDEEDNDNKKIKKETDAEEIGIKVEPSIV